MNEAFIIEHYWLAPGKHLLLVIHAEDGHLVFWVDEEWLLYQRLIFLRIGDAEKLPSVVHVHLFETRRIDELKAIIRSNLCRLAGGLHFRNNRRFVDYGLNFGEFV